MYLVLIDNINVLVIKVSQYEGRKKLHWQFGLGGWLAVHFVLNQLGHMKLNWLCLSFIL